ncbi:hypothetical protein CRENPOLYSF2_1390012 [Crenothrix polyspora]|uniref:Uncharacterized protein n=1 Tax=Crenothrix polyspora TaxID=360316 RepID=A0A1R4H0Z4_9GAMM|nr:hypothetical protein CRENPOLYSF2_1390012 [Crenothrix polyspora]
MRRSQKPFPVPKGLRRVAKSEPGLLLISETIPCSEGIKTITTGETAPDSSLRNHSLFRRD